MCLCVCMCVCICMYVCIISFVLRTTSNVLGFPCIFVIVLIIFLLKSNTCSFMHLFYVAILYLHIENKIFFFARVFSNIHLSIHLFLNVFTVCVIILFPACSDGNWGSSCKKCGHCETGDICDKTTGHCTQCEIGWELPNCTGRYSAHL